MKTPTWSLRTLVSVLALLVVTGCGDDDPAAPEPEFTFEPMLPEMWPAQDGNNWSFSATGVERQLPDLTGYASMDDVPPPPTFEDLYASLLDPAGQGTTRNGDISLQFDGVHDYLPGAQVIRVGYSGGAEPPMPFVNDEALWRIEDDRIVGCTEYQGCAGWIYLTSDLEPGDGFFHTLYEGVEYDITLEGRVWRHLQVPWEGEMISCVEVVYLVDQGITGLQQTAEGSYVEYFRSYTYGVVVYGQNVGPLSWKEKRVQAPSSVTQDLGYIEPAKVLDTRMTLKSVILAGAASGSGAR